MKIAAVGDIHGDKYFSIFKKELNNLDSDVLLLCGDITNYCSLKQLEKVFVEINKKNIRTLMCPGNNEYEEYFPEIKKLCKKYNIKFLNDEKTTIGKYTFIGTLGVLDEPTYWQLRNIPNIREKYELKLNKIENLLKKSKNVILFMHYVPGYENLKGEKPFLMKRMGSLKMKELILRYKPLIVFHAHAHHGSKECEFNGIKVINVSLPLIKEIYKCEV